MRKATAVVFKLLVNSFIISATGYAFCYFSPESSTMESISFLFAFYGTIATFYIFLTHLLMVILRLIIKEK
jgi:hypothetical protein